MNSFLELECYQIRKTDKQICGDVFLKDRQGGRTFCTLSDGLGSGVKANVLASLTATMAQEYVRADMDLRSAAATIMRTLPVCRERKISYSTFTIADVSADGETRIINYDNPRFFFFRNGEAVEPPDEQFPLPGGSTPRPGVLRFSKIRIAPGDRLVFLTDGVTQAGMGTRSHPLGWRRERVGDYIAGILENEQDISARTLCRRIAEQARLLDLGHARDDISCGVLYVRSPRELILASGPPVDPARDTQLARQVDSFTGRKIICGGTTANLVARELGRRVRMNLGDRTDRIPPSSSIEGIDLVTEGILTLSVVLDHLRRGVNPEDLPADPAVRIVRFLMASDRVTFLSGTKINEAHQDPALPMELGIRRTVIRQIADELEHRYLKEIRIIPI